MNYVANTHIACSVAVGGAAPHEVVPPPPSDECSYVPPSVNIVNTTNSSNY